MIFRKLMYKKMMQQFYGFFGGAGLAKEKSSSFLVSSSWRGTSTSVTSSSSSSSTLTIKLVVAVVGDNASASKSDSPWSSKVYGDRVECPVVLNRCNACAEETVDTLGLTLPSVREGVFPPFACLFFTSMCHFFRALDVWSSKTDFFIREPI